MNYVKLAFTYLVDKPLLTLLAVIFVIVPVIIINSVMLFRKEAKRYFLNNVTGADIILSAKVSPAEVVRNTLFHTGPALPGISLEDTRTIITNPAVRFAVPLYMHYNYKGHRIVGTNHNYHNLFHASIQTGRWWSEPFEAVLGYNTAKQTGLQLGDAFYSGQGLEEDTGKYINRSFRVCGIMNRENSSLDNIILTSIENTWNLGKVLHDSSVEVIHHPAPRSPSDYFPFDFPDRADAEISSAIVKLRGPVAASSFIRQKSLQSDFQAINPVNEISREFRSLEFTLSALNWAGISILSIGLLALFVRLFYFVHERSEDLILLRTIGASKRRIMFIVILQGLLISDLAVFSGILLSHGAIGIMSTYPLFREQYGITGNLVSWKEVLIYFCILAAGVLASVIPAIRAGKVTVSIPPREI